MDKNTPEINVPNPPEAEKIENEVEIAVEEPKPKKQKRERRGAFRNGLIISGLGRLTEAIYRALFCGLFLCVAGGSGACLSP